MTVTVDSPRLNKALGNALVFTPASALQTLLVAWFTEEGVWILGSDSYSVCVDLSPFVGQPTDAWLRQQANEYFVLQTDEVQRCRRQLSDVRKQVTTVD